MGVDRTNVTWQWLAGFTDGDGCIQTNEEPRRQISAVRVSWGQKDEDAEVLDAISEFLASEGVIACVYKSAIVTQGHAYPQAVLSVANQAEVYVLLQRLAPFLVAKQDKAYYGIALLDYITEQRENGVRNWRIALAEGV